MHLLAAIAFAAGLAAPSRPTLATEDTMRVTLPEVLVRAPRVTLDEILDRVARGEARRESLLTDQSFLLTLRVVRDASTPGKPPQVVRETVSRVYRKRPDKVRVVRLRDYDASPGRHRTSVRVRARSDMGEEIVNFAFQPSAHRDFRYRIAGRDLVGDHLVYRIAFTPRSLLDPGEPRGLVWVDTNDFVIVRQEVFFDRSPAAPLLKRVDRLVVERTNVEGHWVLHRVLMRAESLLPLPGVGRSFDLTLLYDQYAINHGLPDSVFARAEAPR